VLSVSAVETIRKTLTAETLSTLRTLRTRGEFKLGHYLRDVLCLVRKGINANIVVRSALHFR